MHCYGQKQQAVQRCAVLYDTNKNTKDNQNKVKAGIYANDMLCKAIVNYEAIQDSSKKEKFMLLIKQFCRLYSFIIQATSFDDVKLHKKYRFIQYLLLYLNKDNYGIGFDIASKIKADNFVQKNKGKYIDQKIKASPIIRLPIAEPFGLTEDKIKRLSEIIAEINSLMGRAYDKDVAIKAMLQVKDIMMKSDDLKMSAKNNTEKDFELSYLAKIDDALIEGLAQNKDFFTMLLNNNEIKKNVMGIFVEEIYRTLRNNQIT